MRTEVSYSALILCFVALTARGSNVDVTAPQAVPTHPAQFMSAVQIAIDESSPQLTERSQRVVREQFNHALQVLPELQGRPYETRTLGNEVIFYFVTPEDMRVPMQNAISVLIQNINGRVRGRGRSSFYRTPLTQPLEASLETAVSDEKTKIVSISAQSAPLRDLLKQLKSQLRTFSYVIPGECADRKIDWNFATAPDEAKPVDAFMAELAALFNLQMEKRNGTHIFSGACHGAVTEVDSMLNHRPAMPAVALDGYVPIPVGNGNQFQRVYFPVPPIGYY